MKKLRAQYQNTENLYEKTVKIERIKLIKEHIIDKIKENRSKSIIKVAQQIKSNVDNVGKIREIKRKVQRKNQAPHTVKDEENNRIECSFQILEEHKRNTIYKNLPKTRSQRQLRRHRYSVKQKGNSNRSPIDRGTKKKELQKS